ncbi:MAG: tetratricopeptide repeat protein [Putridiphycobacter sp.]
MKRLLLIFIIFLSSFAFGQDPEIVLVIKALDETTNKNLPGVNIEIYKDGKKIRTEVTNSKGKVPLIYLPVGSVYQIKFKKDGYVTKMAELDGRYDTPEDLEFETSRDMKFYLFPSVEGVDFSFLEREPMVKFEFSPDGYEFVWDLSYSKQMQKKIDNLKKEIEERQEELEKEKEEKAKMEADFQAYVKAGDAANSKGKFETAVEQYDLALKIKDDAGVKAKRDAAQKALDDLAKQEQLEKDYQAKIGEAKAAFDSKDYQKAIDLYTQASQLKPSEDLPKTEIAKIQKILSDQKANQAKFDQLVAAGDKAVGAENYDDAISKYTEALGLFDDEGVKTKLENAKKLKADKEAADKAEADKKAQFDALVKDADNLFDKKDLNAAKEKYLQAQLLYPEDNHVKSQLQLVEQKIQEEKDKAAAEQEKEAVYQAKMAEAKSAYDGKNYEDALKLYTEASQMKTTEDEPKQKIKEINDILKQQAEKEADFQKYVSEGDQALNSELYDDAIAKYNLALGIKDDAAVKEKIAQAEKLKNDKINAENAAKAKEEQYQAAIDAADKAFDSQDWQTALTKYNEALTIKPGEQHPTDRIADINQRIADQKAKEEAAKAKQQKYDDLISQADALFSDGKLNEAKAKYTEASLVFPEESKPKNKIDEINNLLTAQADKAKKDAEYQAAMDEANNFYNDKKYEEALSAYNKALGIYDRDEPKAKINEINTLLADLKSDAQREADYQKKMAEGNDLLASNNLNSALSAFKEALALKPNDQAATDKISEIEAKIKANQEAEALQKQIDELIKKGNTAFDAKDYPTAKENYQQAIDLKNGDAVLEQKIKDIDALIAKNQSQAELQAQFDKLMQEADDAYAAVDYNKALVKYIEADALIPSQKAKDRIAEIKQKIADQEAKDAKEKQYNDLITQAQNLESSEKWQDAINKYKEAYDVKPTPEIKTKIGALQTKLTEQTQNEVENKAYQEKIELADAKFQEGDWKQAIGYYKDAKLLDDSKTYPDEQIAKAEQKMKEESEAEVEKNYQKIIKKADEFFNAEDYDNAKSYYERALGFKPNDQYPKDQLAEIQKRINEKNNAENAAEAAEQAYRDLVKSADEQFNAKNYKSALEKYLEAQNIKPTDGYVIGKIEETKAAINNLSAEAKKRAQYEALIGEADALMGPKTWGDAKKKYEEALKLYPAESYPKAQILICDEQMKKETGGEANAAYQKLLTVAEKKFNEKDYKKALELYKRAQGMNPSDPLPPNKISEINQILKDKAVNDKYNALIQKADNLFESQNWKEARPIYQQAFEVKNDQYPKDQIAKIDQKLGGFNKEQYDKMIAKADDYFAKANYEKAKGLYLRAIKFQPTWDNTYPKAQLLEIKNILNPPKAVSSTLRDLGDPVVGMTEEEMEKMLMTDEEQREFNESKKVVDHKEEVMSFEHDWAEKENEATIKAKETTNQIESDVTEMAWEGEIEREKAEQATIKQTEEYVGVNREIAEYNEHAIFRQKEVITGLTDDISDVEYNAELERQEYEAEVVNIQTDINTQKEFEANNQTNEVFNTKVYVDNEKEKHVTNDPNMDVARKNMEVRVIDMKVENNNEMNQNSWQQEDYAFETKENVTIMKDEQNAYMIGADLNRQSMEDKVVEIEETNTAYAAKIQNKQTDNSFETKNYSDHLQDEIVVNNMANDVPRQKMEVVKENITEEVASTEMGYVANQNANTNNTKDYADQEVEKQSEIFYNKEVERQGYEEVVVDITEEIDTKQKVLADDNQNSSFATKDQVEIEKDKNQQMKNEGNQSTIKNQDVVNETTQDLKDKQVVKTDQNQEKVNQTEDYLTNMKKDVNTEKEEVYTKNKLGEKYPEGVTEEIYQEKDESGLLQAYTIRRIVVIEGQGFVYEKTKTRYGTTYTKDGEGITESKWSEETNNANLVRN